MLKLNVAGATSFNFNNQIVDYHSATTIGITFSPAHVCRNLDGRFHRFTSHTKALFFSDEKFRLIFVLIAAILLIFISIEVEISFIERNSLTERSDAALVLAQAEFCMLSITSVRVVAKGVVSTPLGLCVHAQLGPLYFLHCVLDEVYPAEYYPIVNACSQDG